MEQYIWNRSLGDQITRKADRKIFMKKTIEYGGYSEEAKARLVEQINIMRELQHPHILSYIDRIIRKKGKTIHIIMEYCEGGHLGKYIQRKRQEREIQPQHVFLDASNNAKLGNFGLAKEFAENNPELINQEEYDEGDDIWALGCLVYELCALTPPFFPSNQGEFQRIPSLYSDDLFQVIRWMLRPQKAERANIKDLETIIISH